MHRNVDFYFGLYKHYPNAYKTQERVKDVLKTNKTYTQTQKYVEKHTHTHKHIENTQKC